MGEEREQEVAGFKRRQRGTQAFGRGHVRAGRRWDDLAAHHHQRHVDDAADDEPEYDGKNQLQDGHVVHLFPRCLPNQQARAQPCGAALAPLSAGAMPLSSR